MKVLTTLFAMVMIVTLLAVAALVQLVIALLPFVAVALIVTVALRARRRVPPPAAAAGWPGSGYPVRVASRPRYLVGAPASAPEGWVMVPVWVAPTRGPRVIDAEVITNRE